MRTKLPQVLKGGDPSQVASLFAAYQDACVLDALTPGDDL